MSKFNAFFKVSTIINAFKDLKKVKRLSNNYKLHIARTRKASILLRFLLFFKFHFICIESVG